MSNQHLSAAVRVANILNRTNLTELASALRTSLAMLSYVLSGARNSPRLKEKLVNYVLETSPDIFKMVENHGK